MSRIKYVRAPEEATLACAHPVPVLGSLEKYSTAFSTFFTQARSLRAGENGIYGNKSTIFTPLA